ncbi:MAG TPA: dephospho-CoA kinase, partial [Sphingomicrobium sp.]
MIRIALTGSIGMGKSTVARMFEKAGVPVFDADAEVRRLQGPGGALVERIGERFPGTVEGGVLDRDRLAAQVLE